MVRVFVAGFLLLVIAFWLSAREVDQLTERDRYEQVLPDSLPRLNEKTNLMLSEALDSFNARFKSSETSLTKAQALKYLALYIHTEIARESRIFLPTEEEDIPYTIDTWYALAKSGRGPLQVWIEDSDLQGPFLQHAEENVYRNAYPPGFNDTNSIKLNGYLVGTDKIDHFFDQGYAYWRISDNGHDDAKAVAYGVDSEWGMFGLDVAGVFSYGDLAANWAGYGFFKKLDSYFELQDDRTFRQVKSFDWAVFVSSQWDEVLNPSALSPNLFDTMKNYISQREVLYNEGSIDYSYKTTANALIKSGYRPVTRSPEYLNDKLPLNLPSYADLILWIATNRFDAGQDKQIF